MIMKPGVAVTSPCTVPQPDGPLGTDMGGNVRRSIKRVAVTAVVAAGASLMLAAPAMAAGHANCYTNDMCYWYQSNFTGSQEGFASSVSDLSSPAQYFQGVGTGQGQPVWNNAGSGANFNTTCKAAVYYSAGYQGIRIVLNSYPNSGYASATLGSLSNNDRSHLFCV
jgi:hypothetical protein